METKVIEKTSVPKSYLLFDIRLVKNCLLQMLVFLKKIDLQKTRKKIFFQTSENSQARFFDPQEKIFDLGTHIFFLTHKGTMVRDTGWH